jgi:acetyl-CoA/propionyl-CoA carboxylase biotin carboxyl carrier protein
VVVEVGGKRFEVSLPAALMTYGDAAHGGSRPPRRSAGGRAGQVAGGDALTSPMQGTIVKVVVEEGQQVEAGELVIVLEAMKMEQPINAHKAGTITGLAAEVGATVANGAVLCEIKD